MCPEKTVSARQKPPHCDRCGLVTVSLKHTGRLWLCGRHSENGLTSSSGPTGPPSPSESAAPPTVSANTAMKQAGVSLVRRHQGRGTISVGFLTECPTARATFIALREDHGAGAVMVTLSLKLELSQWRQLEKALTMLGHTNTVAFSFEPTTPNEAPPTTAEST